MNPIPFPELLASFRRDPLSLVGQVPGIFPVNKPEGISSHQAVAIARKRLNLRRIGHAGTLDPMADGLLLLLAGNATRLFDEIQTMPKTYHARLRFGYRTDTQDRTGTTIETFDRAPPTREQVEQELASFRGEIMQTPPMYSALKKDGVPLYKLARENIEVTREPRPVTVYELALTDCDGREAGLTMTVSKGFYVRTLIDDLGLKLGMGATMTALTRTAIGMFQLETAFILDEIQP
jgi:tRNA pseudouridine55 synthase